MITLKEHIQLQEAGLSRILQHMQQHDTGGITAWRTARDCGSGEKYTRKENDIRNKSLLAKLMSKGYGVIHTRGEYPEGGGAISNENSFFVFDKDDTGNLESDLRKLGQMFDQDAVLFVPKGTTDGILIGTNRCPNNDIPFGKKFNIGKRFMGKKGKEGSSKVGKRTWAFGTILKEEVLPSSGLGRSTKHRIANMTWEEYYDQVERWENE